MKRVFVAAALAAVQIFLRVLQAQAPAPAAWDPTFELTATVEIERQGGLARRPYLALWVEDRDGYPVRTLALWFDKERYLSELISWTRADRLRSMRDGTQILRSVSSATRPAGR